MSERFERGQFTCYRSFYEAIKRIKKAADRAKAYDILMDYALNGIEPETDKLPDAVAITYFLIKPTLDTSKRKAESGKLGGSSKQDGSKTEATGKQNASKAEATGKRGEKPSEKEKEGEKENEKEKESYNPLSPFERFWEAYPRKVGKLDAERAFRKVKVPIDQLLSAVEVQKRSLPWQKDNGQYIPNPATWLNQGRWADELPPATGQATAGPGKLSDLDLAALDRMVREAQEMHEDE